MTASPGPARGVLRHPATPGAFEHSRHAPQAELAGLVEHYWSVRWNLDGLPAQLRETLPHPNVHLVFETGVTAIFGPHSGRYTRRLEGCGGVFGVKFRPGGFYPFLGRAISEIADTSLSLENVFGAAASGLHDAVLAAATVAEQIDLAARFLLAHRPPHDVHVDRAADLVAAIAADRSLISVEALQARSGLNLRALQRLFKQYVGVGPKWVINRYRLHEALERIAAGEVVDWASFAHSLGYFDQAHFVRDFTRLVGRSPGSYLRGA